MGNFSRKLLRFRFYNSYETIRNIDIFGRADILLAEVPIRYMTPEDTKPADLKHLDATPVVQSTVAIVQLTKGRGQG